MVEAHLVTLCSLFQNGMNDADVNNAGKTHLIINADNGCTLGFAGQTEVRYANVISGEEWFKMMVPLSGEENGRIETNFNVFSNKDRNGPIVVPNVANWSGPKHWIHTLIMSPCLMKNRMIKKLPIGRTRLQFVDN